MHVVMYVHKRILPQAIVWNVRHCRFKHQLLGHKGRVFAADLNADASIAYTASGDKVGMYIPTYMYVRTYILVLYVCVYIRMYVHTS